MVISLVKIIGAVVISVIAFALSALSVLLNDEEHRSRAGVFNE